MIFYFAPLEGITNYIYRNTCASFYKDADKYFTPFLIVNAAGCIAPKSKREILPENNKDLFLVPQLLTKSADIFNSMVEKLKKQGYKEVNLNFGCPSGTVTSKGRGAGQLIDTDKLQSFLDEIFKNKTVDISIKTRIGYSSPDEMEKLLNIFNNYPLKELIVHPRIREDYYKGKINLDVFRETVNNSRNPVCYNGDLFTAEQIREFTQSFPTVDRIMLGRGLIANPGLIKEYRTGEKMDMKTFRAFHDALFVQYSEYLSGPTSLLYKMKDYWKVWKINFPDNPREIKKLQKVQSLTAYSKAIDSLFN